MSQQQIIIMVTFSVLVTIILFFYIQKYEKKERERENQLFIGKRNKDNIKKFYQILCSNQLTGTYTKRIARRYELLYPSLEDLIAKKTVILVFSGYGIDVFLFIFLYIIRPSIINLITAIFIIYVVQITIFSHMVRSTELKLLEQLDLHLSDIKHYYAVSKDITNAIWYTIEHVKKEFRPHIEKIFQIVSSSTIKRETKIYNETNHNKFLKLLLGICVKTAEQGDSFNKRGDSVFTENINILKKDIRREIKKIRKANFIFSELTIVTVLPVISLSFIKDWAVNNENSLRQFYSGKIGFYSVVFIFCLTFVCYHLLERLRDSEDLYQKKYPFLEKISNIKVIKFLLESRTNKRYEKILKTQDTLKRLGEKYSVSTLILRQIIWGCIGFILGIMILMIAHRTEYNMILTTTYDLYEQLPQRDQSIITEEDLSNIIIEYKKEGTDAILNKLRMEGITNKAVLEQLESRINQKLEKADNNYIKWYEVCVMLFVVVAFYSYPYMMLVFKKQFLNDYMTEEVLSFQTILSMYVYVKGTSLIEMLESMELFARVFKPSIQTCINNMNRNDTKALLELKGSEKFLGFQRLIDCFLRAEYTDIPIAFHEVIDDIKHFQDMYELEIDMILQRKQDIASLIAFAPGVVIVTLYLTLPFIIAGFQMFESSFQDNINNITY